MKTTRVLAFYLPQFHCIAENDEWWGKGFTEWTNVMSGESFYEGHYQPKVPLGENYYNLLDVETLRWQAQLAKQYGIDGFCIYHYWFNGKKLLEKPVELLLNSKNINISYCLSWANETWSRRWTGDEKKILIKQEYGGIEDWEEHLLYLIQFFNDDRYIKINNQPVLLIYRIFDIFCYEEMIDFWNNKIKEYGFSGIYFIETLNATQKVKSSNKTLAAVEFEPMFSIHSNSSYFRRFYRYLFNHCNLSRIGLLDFLNYDKVYSQILKRNRDSLSNIFFCAFPGWDNSARRGRNGLVFKNTSPEKFEKYFGMQYVQSIKMKKEFIFINAWNEWGEGAYLEPDSFNNYKYLEAVKRVIEEI